MYYNNKAGWFSNSKIEDKLLFNKENKDNN